MADSYEAVIPKVARELFQDSFIRYMTGLDFAHIAIGGRLGRYSTHEFKRDDDLVSMIVSSGGINDLLVVVHSSGIDVERLVMDALTEGLADFLDTLCGGLSDRDVRQTMRSLTDNLRDAFERVLAESGESS